MSPGNPDVLLSQVVYRRGELARHFCAARNVRFWHKADIWSPLANVCFRGFRGAKAHKLNNAGAFLHFVCPAIGFGQS
jgi:hypothetical protein